MPRAADGGAVAERLAIGIVVGGVHLHPPAGLEHEVAVVGRELDAAPVMADLDALLQVGGGLGGDGLLLDFQLALQHPHLLVERLGLLVAGGLLLGQLALELTDARDQGADLLFELGIGGRRRRRHQQPGCDGQRQRPVVQPVRCFSVHSGGTPVLGIEPPGIPEFVPDSASRRELPQINESKAYSVRAYPWTKIYPLNTAGYSLYLALESAIYSDSYA